MLKKHFKFFTFLMGAFLITTIATAQPDTMQPAATPTPNNQVMTQPSLIPSPPNVPATAYVLMDADSGKILAQKNMNQRHPPASLTKMMSLYLISQAIQSGTIHADDNVRISKKAWQTGGSKMFVRVGTEVPVKDLIQGIIVDSGNDACVAMSEYIAGSEGAFTDMMNKQAQILNMTNTHYMDCTGLPIGNNFSENHYSTAYNLALLARALVKDFPQDYQWYKQKWFTYNNIRQPNRNRLLWRYPYADGIKTGHTSAAGFCLVSSAIKDGHRLISVVLGAPTDEARSNDSIQLLTYGFRFFDTHLLYQAGSTIQNAKVWFGDESTVPATVTDNLYVTTPTGQYKNIKMAIDLQQKLKAPIKMGQTIGQLTVMLNNNPIETQPLVADKAVEKAGMIHRMFQHIGFFFHGWFSSSKQKVAAPAGTENNNIAATPTQQMNATPNNNMAPAQPSGIAAEDTAQQSASAPTPSAQ